MNVKNEIETITTANCIIHICDNCIVKTKQEQEKVWEEFSRIACKLYTNKE